MNATDIVAYGCEGELYCPEHIVIDDGDEEAGHVWPVFADNEGWQDHCCSACLAEAIAAGEKPETLGEANGY